MELDELTDVSRLTTFLNVVKVIYGDLIEYSMLNIFSLKSFCHIMENNRSLDQKKWNKPLIRDTWYAVVQIIVWFWTRGGGIVSGIYILEMSPISSALQLNYLWPRTDEHYWYSVMDRHKQHALKCGRSWTEKYCPCSLLPRAP